MLFHLLSRSNPLDSTKMDIARRRIDRIIHAKTYNRWHHIALYSYHETFRINSKCALLLQSSNLPVLFNHYLNVSSGKNLNLNSISKWHIFSGVQLSNLWKTIDMNFVLSGSWFIFCNTCYCILCLLHVLDLIKWSDSQRTSVDGKSAPSNIHFILSLIRYSHVVVNPSV